MGRLNFLYKTDLPHRAKLVYIYLHDRMDKEKKAWPGLNTIAKDLSDVYKRQGSRVPQDT